MATRRIGVAAGWTVSVFLLFAPFAAVAIEASDRYRSPRNPERKVRRSTDLIVLHTTEAPARSSLNKLSDRGEAHYCVTEEGRVYRIVDRDKEAFHAGRSMWRGKEDVDKFSIGIECVGYHNKPMSIVQIAAIRQLVKELKAMYRLTDNEVVSHCHVAYGAPNKWHRKKHRGRKRCGMLFVMPSVRRVLELSSRPAFDPDVKARRLVVGDDYLNKVLYGRIDTMTASYPARNRSPAPALPVKRKTPVIAQRPSAPKAVKPAGSVRISDKRPAATVQARRPRDIGELKSGGWKLVGRISKSATASKLAGAKWNAADTYYTIRDKVIAGNEIDPARIEKDMGVWVRR